MKDPLTEVYAALSTTWDRPELPQNPWALFAERREQTPVMEGDLTEELGVRASYHGEAGRKTFTFFRYDDIAAILRDKAGFSSAIMMEVLEPVAGRVIVGMDGEEHTFWRRLIQPAFGRPAMKAWDTEVVRPVAKRLSQELAAGGASADLVPFGMQFPVHMIYGILGFDDPNDFERFHHAAGLMLAGPVTITATDTPEQGQAKIARSRAASDDLYKMVLEIVRERRADGAAGDDLISKLVKTEDSDGNVFDDDQIAVFVRSLMAPSTENTSRQFVNTMYCLLERPELFERVCADRSLVNAAIIETERFETSRIITRRATADCQIRGVKIPAGSDIHLVLQSGNRDPEAFADPDTFSLDRIKPKQNLSFGIGPHVCPGMVAARQEQDAMINALLDRLPNLRVDPAKPLEPVRGVQFRGPLSLCVIWD